MASFSGMIGGCGSNWLKEDSEIMRKRNDRFRVCSVSSSYSDPYKTLRIHRGASESEVKKAFRKLALQYHPDVCRGNNCGVQFHQINEAYDRVMSKLREESTASEMEMNYGPPLDAAGTNEEEEAVYEPDWDTWEEWMGWDGKEQQFPSGINLIRRFNYLVTSLSLNQKDDMFYM